MRRSFVLILLASLLLSAPARALPSCASESERQAMMVRGLQSYFMMAGVACNQASAYNKFMTRYQSQVSAQGLILKNYFKRVYAGSAETRLNDFITELANGWSHVHMKNMSAYCKGAWDLMWKLDHETAQLTTLSSAVTQQPSITALMCSDVAGPAKVAAK